MSFIDQKEQYIEPNFCIFCRGWGFTNHVVLNEEHFVYDEIEAVSCPFCDGTGIKPNEG